MISTAILVAALVGMLVLQFALGAWFLQGGLRIAKANKPAFKASFVTNLAIWLVYVVMLAPSAALLWAAPENRTTPGLIVLGAWVIYFVLSLRMIGWRHQTSQKQAFVGWLAIQLAALPSWLFAAGVMRPFVFEAFKIPTNAMAPTICGEHLEQKCPNCGGKLIISSASVKSDQDLGICSVCLRTAEVPIQDRTVHSGDRVLVLKFLKPRRWDLIVFRYPEEPTTFYVKRLVGLPGETLSIHDGGVWVQEQELPKPAELSGLTYLANPDRPRDNIWGPVTLAADESFVLGDFSARSKDSRFWQNGAPGHPPYAVPDSHLVGVVTHIYWPPSRWRLFR